MSALLLLLLFNTTRARTHSGPPSTGATITMDGGVADTTRERSNVGTGTAHLAFPLRSAVLPPVSKNLLF